ncbi:hypothetical protein [Nodularia sphaerocarpa]|uniref:hypothetical protein n=1 Tax=Nodularia sphaerocarpa TaxID=137816 RepID=UPI001EFC23E2|nr:hypothetical protein [Nodularia sphaerocarpa]MDB9375204.1 hypothetical protein [Nodularia sphaerocarpa CS-585]MDB9378682.1 hypothetical protein [Nodularia sphaerocarpa CS-585A2]ULP71472.1 hypothetical protein BDGGKGIB_01098 [Nodularia sphaerocarpa UHCC 0038]
MQPTVSDEQYENINLQLVLGFEGSPLPLKIKCTQFCIYSLPVPYPPGSSNFKSYDAQARIYDSDRKVLLEKGYEVYTNSFTRFIDDKGISWYINIVKSCTDESGKLVWEFDLIREGEANKLLKA